MTAERINSHPDYAEGALFLDVSGAEPQLCVCRQGKPDPICIHEAAPIISASLDAENPAYLLLNAYLATGGDDFVEQHFEEFIWLERYCGELVPDPQTAEGDRAALAGYIDGQLDGLIGPEDTNDCGAERLVGPADIG